MSFFTNFRRTARMQADFPRVLTLLRKEKGISQKKAAAELEISQALLSHYEKGIRECGLDFLVRAADYYNVSCDYLLGRSPEKDGSIISVEDIPEPETVGKENALKGSMVPVLNKKLISNSLNIIFDMLRRSNSKEMTSEVSSYLMLSVYKVFRYMHSSNPKNDKNFFNVPKESFSLLTASAMNNCEAELVETSKSAEDEGFVMSTDGISKAYPLFASSLYNLVQNSENKILGKK